MTKELCPKFYKVGRRPQVYVQPTNRSILNPHHYLYLLCDGLNSNMAVRILSDYGIWPVGGLHLITPMSPIMFSLCAMTSKAFNWRREGHPINKSGSDIDIKTSLGPRSESLHRQAVPISIDPKLTVPIPKL